MIDIFLELRYTLCDAFQLIHRIKIARNDERVLPSSSFSEIRMLSRRGGEAKKKEGVWKIKILADSTRFYFQTPPSPDRTGERTAVRECLSSSAFC